PRDLDVDDITAGIVAVEGVESTHHLHIWHLASDTIALSAHVVAAKTSTLEQAQSIAEEIRQMLDRRFNITHTTLEMEDHPCTDPPVRRDPGRETPV
ncbi:MAG: cation transporter dimerization domain-containing protein, partial [Acidimicrobiia bacterium]